ncbi:DegV family protein [Bacillus massiliigorillae]|uniref:DegV family protein n=1 Tax=Bacillus massiliigorillae TaxID=1243664 RepID=UPI00039B536D|nr:DegV family protein [Bacillus massiliigorillae]
MNKPKVAWITDSTSSLNKELIEKYNIHVVPLNVVINGVSFKETVDMTEEELYIRMKTEEGSFQTSQPSVGEFVNLYEKLKEDYDYGIAIHASSKLSGTYNTSLMAAEMAGFPLYGIDSETGSFGLGQLIQKGIKLHEQGFLAEEIVLQLNKLKKNTRIFLIPANLEQLHKSGRVSGSQKLLACLFNIKPILAIEDGKATIKDKVRSHKKAHTWVINQLKEDLKNHSIHTVAILHANDFEKAIELEQLVKDELPEMETVTLMLISVAGVHTGVSTVGLSWVCE